MVLPCVCHLGPSTNQLLLWSTRTTHPHLIRSSGSDAVSVDVCMTSQRLRLDVSVYRKRRIFPPSLNQCRQQKFIDILYASEAVGQAFLCWCYFNLFIIIHGIKKLNNPVVFWTAGIWNKTLCHAFKKENWWPYVARLLLKTF